ncbi:MAG: hypothetical protein QHH07_10305, partial [Sedimentisphaerales bacterium]|nr:hypothetical protein [Sedimentisphaerales bacterium]
MNRSKSIAIIIPASIVLLASTAKSQLITKAILRNTQTPQPVIVTEGLKEGSPVFLDRTHVYREIPGFLLGAEYVMLSNNDKTTANYELEIALSADAYLYLFIDNRVGDDTVDSPPTLPGVMQWVIDMGFQSTNTQIGVDERGAGIPNGWSAVYRLKVPAGTVVLGPQNDNSSRRMYGVAAVLVLTLATDPRPFDREQDVAIGSVLAWRPCEDAIGYDVYLGTRPEDVQAASRTDPHGVLAAQAHDANTFDPPGDLLVGQTYYWRVDTLDPSGAISKGP